MAAHPRGNPVTDVIFSWTKEICTSADLVLVDHPALMLSTPTIMALAVFDDLIDRQVFQTRICSQLLAVTSLAYARCAGDDDVGLCSRHFLRSIGSYYSRARSPEKWISPGRRPVARALKKTTRSARS